MTDVATITIAGLTAAQKRALVLADNKLALNAGWDEALLRIELQELQADDFDISTIGFDVAELADMLAEGNFQPVSADEQGRLDQRAPVTCPQCGHVFAP